MKKFKKKFDEIIRIDYLLDVYHTIRLNTKHRGKLLIYEMFLSTNLHKIMNRLKNREYRHGKYNIFLIKENKYRIIMSENLEDKIVNHLISKYLLNDAIDNRLLDMNVATRKGKGTKYGILYLKKYINKIKQNHDKVYVLKCDIKKYFYNINHDILIEKLNDIILDKDIKEILSNIIHSTNEKYVNQTILKIINNEKQMVINSNKSNKENLLNELNSIPLYKYNRGLPIGNLSSQILAIFYLNDLDHYIKEVLKVPGYVRYMDDFCLIYHDKEYLKDCIPKIENKLKDLKLELNDKTRIYDMDYGIDFLGYKFKLVNKKLIMRVTYKNKVKIIRKLKKLHNIDIEKFDRSYASYMGYVKQNSSLKYVLETMFKD